MSTETATAPKSPDAAPAPKSAEQNAKSKGKGRGKGQSQRRGGQGGRGRGRNDRNDRNDRRGGRSFAGPRDFGRARFDVEQLTELAGDPLFEAVHEAKLLEIKGSMALLDVSPKGHDALKAKMNADELKSTEIGQTFSVYLSSSNVLPSAAIVTSKPSAKKIPEVEAEAKVDATEAKDESESSLKEEPAVVASEWAEFPWAFLQQVLGRDRLDRIGASAVRKERVPGVIAGETRGGYSVSLLPAKGELEMGLRAFLPKSHATLGRFSTERVVGATDDFDVTEFEAERANIVVSRRAKLVEAQKELETTAWDRAKEGEVLECVVKSLVPYGAFVDIGGLDGLLHVSDLSWDRQPRVKDVLREGQMLKLQVLVSDPKSKKLKLGLKQLTEDPWGKVRDALDAGSTVDGTVVGFAEFGVFIHLAEGIEGLIHTSEISWKQTRRPEERFSIGEEIKVKVLDVDGAHRRISLSTKALEPNPFQAVADRFPVGTVLKAVVSSLADFGAFVQIDENVEGLVHIGELSWTERFDHPSQMLTLGDEVEVVVLKVDVDKQRVGCSIKHLQDNPYQKWESTYKVGTRHKLKVSRLVERGVLFELEEGLTGTCSTKELSNEESVSRPAELVKLGQEVEVAVVKYDSRARKVIFSARAVIDGDVRAAYDEYKQREDEGSSSANTTLGDAFAGLSLGGSDDVKADHAKTDED
ncbi:MAG: S1 RNA-binding domain-containing protein [Deltaproteobacteria bacterium]|nr:S1 RNA-binding domain-containing protein [Deltaproteobacteria bacterium]